MKLDALSFFFFFQTSDEKNKGQILGSRVCPEDFVRRELEYVISELPNFMKSFQCSKKME